MSPGAFRSAAEKLRSTSGPKPFAAKSSDARLLFSWRARANPRPLFVPRPFSFRSRCTRWWFFLRAAANATPTPAPKRFRDASRCVSCTRLRSAWARCFPPSARSSLPAKPKVRSADCGFRRNDWSSACAASAPRRLFDTSSAVIVPLTRSAWQIFGPDDGRKSRVYSLL